MIAGASPMTAMSALPEVIASAAWNTSSAGARLAWIPIVSSAGLTIARIVSCSRKCRLEGDTAGFLAGVFVDYDRETAVLLDRIFPTDD